MSTFLNQSSKKIASRGTVQLFITALFLFPACRRRVCCTLPQQAEFQVFVQNDESEDLLNPQTRDAYDTANIEVYYLNDGKATLAFQYNLGHPRFWDIDMDSSRHRYFLSVKAKGKTDAQHLSTTLIKWDRRDTDTVVCQINGSEYNPIKKIWYNGQVVWDGHRPEDTIRTSFVYSATMFTITK